MHEANQRLAKGGSSPATGAANLPQNQELANLKKTIDQQKKNLEELKLKLEQKDKMVNELDSKLKKVSERVPLCFIHIDVTLFLSTLLSVVNCFVFLRYIHIL